jgi:hypothetical protein
VGTGQTPLGSWNPFSTLIDQLEEGKEHTDKDYPQNNIDNHEKPLVKAGLSDFKVLKRTHLLYMEPPLKVRDTGGQGRFVPKNPTTQCPRGVGLVPVFTHPRVSFDIPRPTSHILVLRKVAVARGPEGNHALLAILVKDRIPLLALGPRTT